MDRKDIAKVLDALQKHFEPTRNVIYERFKFNTCVQEQGETIDQYITKLKQMAATCKFEQLENELIRDRLVLGAKDSSAKARMLREPNLDLQKAIDMCRNSEIGNAQWKTMNNELDAGMHVAQIMRGQHGGIRLPFLLELQFEIRALFTGI